VRVADDADSSSHACAGGGALVMRHAGMQDATHHFFDGARWRAVPPAPVPLGISSTTVWTGEQLLLWGQGSVVAYDPDAREWSDLGPVGEPSDAVPAGDRVILASFTFGSSFDTIELTRPARR